MKTIQFLIVAFLFSTRLFSQDTLYTKEGNVITGKVMEITKDDIRYKRSSNPDGPMYVISKSDVVVIEYKNGSKDVFSKTAAANTNDANAQQSQANNNNNNSNYSQGGNPVYVTPRPAVNVILGGGSPYYGYSPWGWGFGGGWGGYRSLGYYRGGYGGYHGGYGGYHGGYGHGGGGGHYGHHR